MAQAAVKQMNLRSAIINTGEIPPIIGGYGGGSYGTRRIP